MNPLDLDPQVVAAKLLVEGMKDMKPVLKEILEQFGISKEDDFKGLIPLAVLLYPSAKELKIFLHNLVILEGQLMKYLDNLGSDVQGAANTIQQAITLDPLGTGGITP